VMLQVGLCFECAHDSGKHCVQAASTRSVVLHQAMIR
jgi:hypothetical protein